MTGEERTLTQAERAAEHGCTPDGEPLAVSEIVDDEAEAGTAEGGAAGAELALVGAGEVVALRTAELAGNAPGGPLAVPGEEEVLALLRFGKVLMASGMFPDLQGAAQAVVKTLVGRNYGLDAVQSQSAFQMVQGRLTQSARLQTALIKRSGKVDFSIIESTDKRCELEWFEKDGPRGPGWQPVGRSSFSIEDAVKAGLGKSASGRPGAWQNWPKAMCFARALTQGATWFAPHLLFGTGFCEFEQPEEVDE